MEINMAPSTPYFDLLDDPLVQQIIRSVPDLRYDTSRCRNLSETSRRMCALVRCTVRFKRSMRPAQVLRLARISAHRAFSSMQFLSVDGGEMEGIQAHAEYVDAAAAAVAAWPGLEEASLSCCDEACEPGCVSGAILALRAAPALRRLNVSLAVPHSLAFLPVLTQLTELVVEGVEGVDDVPLTLDIQSGDAPLAAMSNLVSLFLGGADLQPAPSCVLPPNLTQLGMWGVELGKAGWAQHVAGCRNLQVLNITTNTADITTHPTLVMQALAGQLPRLRSLCVQGEDQGVDWGVEQLEEVIDALRPDNDSDDSDGEEEWWPNPPLGQEQGYKVAVPPPNMGGLSALQTLRLAGWWLVVSSERYWRHLAGCSSLKSLSDLHAAVPPPAGVTFPGVTRLEVTASTSPGDTLALLAAFPTLQVLDLNVVLSAAPDNASKLPAAAQVALNRLTSARLFFHNVPLSPLALRSALRTYWRTMLPALPRLQQLELSWADSVRLMSHQLGLSALQQLTAFKLRFSYGQVREHAVGSQQVVRLVKGATQLQDVAIYRPLAPGSTKDELVLGLQEALPRLRLVTPAYGPEQLQPATLAALRSGLFVQNLCHCYPF